MTPLGTTPIDGDQGTHTILFISLIASYPYKNGYINGIIIVSSIASHLLVNHPCLFLVFVGALNWIVVVWSTV